MLEIALRRAGHRVDTVNAGETAKVKLETAPFDVFISDVRMPGTDGIEMMQFAAAHCPDTERIIITAHEDFEATRRIAEVGVCAFLVKGGSSLPAATVAAVEQALDKASLRRQNFAFRRDAAQRNSLDHLVGASPAMHKLKNTIRTIAPTSSTVLICGESGTGKELVARAFHDCSPRSGEPFVSVNCGAFPETLLESELFGYVRGAFTGATQNKRGLFEAAHGGTIFLDEIGEMSPGMQVKLLRVLQERVVRPVGGTAETPVDVRVIAATNRELEQMVSSGAFREDLFYRISVIPVRVPPLRDRQDDVVLLAGHFLKKYSAQMGRAVNRIAVDSLDLLKGYDWPGNVRQLENSIERAVALESSHELHVDPPCEAPSPRSPKLASGNGGSPGIAIPPEGLDLEHYVEQIARSLLQSALRRENGVQTRAAGVLHLSYRSFRHLLKKYDLNEKD